MKTIGPNHLQRNLKPTKPCFSVNVGVIWWGGSECACLVVFTKGWGSGEFKGCKGIEPNEPPSPKKAILRDCEQPFSFNKGHLLRPLLRISGLPGKWHWPYALTGYCHIWVSGNLDVLQIRRENGCLVFFGWRWKWNKDGGAVNSSKEVKFFCFTPGSICEYMET